MQVLHIQSQYLGKNTTFSNLSKLSKIRIFPVFWDSNQPSKNICKITNTWNMSPIIKLNIIEYLFLLYINKQLQKKSIKKRNFTFYPCRANRPPLGSLRYGNLIFNFFDFWFKCLLKHILLKKMNKFRELSTIINKYLLKTAKYSWKRNFQNCPYISKI